MLLRVCVHAVVSLVLVLLAARLSHGRPTSVIVIIITRCAARDGPRGEIDRATAVAGDDTACPDHQTGDGAHATPARDRQTARGDEMTPALPEGARAR